jgi:hypothetical protein
MKPDHSLEKSIDRSQLLIEEVDHTMQIALPDSTELRNLHEKLWDIIEDLELLRTAAVSALLK